MKPRRLFPYLIALILLAWILGSLARSGTGGGSLLSNSYWLVYLIQVLPLISLGLIVLMIVDLARNWKDIADALGYGMSRRRRQPRKKSRTVQTIVWISAWTVAAMVLWIRCGGLFCDANSSVQAAATSVENIVSGSGGLPPFPVLGPVLAIAGLLDTNFFVVAFFGLLALSSVIMVRAIKVSWDETRSKRLDNAIMVQQHGQAAVHDAIRVLEDQNGDPRERIMRCYLIMITAAANLGAPVGADRTARELERGIKGMFQLKGPGITTLTGLFEEARYSLHPISEDESLLAHEALLEIQEELGKTVSIEA